MKLICIAVLVMLHVSVASVFPDDPFDRDVIDRAFFRAFTGGEEIVFYITLSNDDGRGIIQIYEYTEREWETLYVWNPRNFNDEFIVFDEITVLSIFDSGRSLQVGWIDRLEYQEGIASLCVSFDYQLREWEESWID